MFKQCLRAAMTCMLVCLSIGVSLLATPPNVKVNSDSSPYLQNEQQIWISPMNSDIVIADWRDWRFGYRRVAIGVSTDGGATWSDELVPDSPWEKQSDPCLVGDQYGNFYACLLNYSDAGPSNIVVYKTTDNGVFWTGPVTTGPVGDYFEDKQFTTIDRTGGTYDGNYYISWTRFDNPTRILCVRSVDGTASFEDTVLVGPSVYWEPCGGTIDAGQFSIPIVDADGDLHIFWQSYDLIPGECTGYIAIKGVHSTDGGQTFTEPQVAFHNNFNYEYVDGGIDVYGMPNGDCDISGGPYSNTIYISQCQYAVGFGGETDVTVRRSTDKGQTWTDRQVVNDDPPGQNVDQFHPWLVVNEDGVVLLIFYDQRDDPAHWKFNSYFSCSFDGGETYIKNMRISDVSIDPSFAGAAPERAAYADIKLPGGKVSLVGREQYKPRAGLLAEYIGIHANHDTVNTIWTDTRDGTQDCYSARFIIPFNAPRLYLPGDNSEVYHQEVALRWSTCWHEDSNSYRLEITQDPSFTTIDYIHEGLSDNNFMMAASTPVGIYYWRVKAFRTAGDSTDYSEVRQFDAIAPGVTSTSPAQNEINVPFNTNVSATFLVDMDESTMDESTFAIYGAQTGLHAGTISYNSEARKATKDPAVDFQVGERIMATLTSGVESAGGSPLGQSFSWSFTTQAAAAPGQFPAYENYYCGDYPTGILTADLDADGDVDLATAGPTDDSLAILLNNGDATFTSYVTYEVCENPYGIAGGDFDSDGDIDLALACDGSDSVSVLMNNGDATFAARVDYQVGEGPWAVVATDLNGDGAPDLAAAGRISSDVSVLLNNGDGTFAAAVVYSTGNGPRGMDAADVDNDGDFDIVTANTSSSSVGVLLNDGQGNLSAAGSYPTGQFPYTVVAADLNGDGWVDLSTANAGDDSVSVLLNQAGGSFAFHVDYDIGDQPNTAHLVADLDGDLDLDIVTCGGNNASGALLFNNGDGTFGSYSSYSNGWVPWTAAAADLDDDQDIDLATSSHNRVAILLNQDYICGDADGNEIVNISDAVFLIDYVFGGGPAPNPLVAGDTNCDDIVNISDAVYLIAYIFGGGPAPCELC